MTDDRQIQEAFAVIVDGKLVNVRFSEMVASMEAGQKRGKVCPCKIVWVDKPVPSLPHSPGMGVEELTESFSASLRGKGE